MSQLSAIASRFRRKNLSLPLLLAAPLLLTACCPPDCAIRGGGNACSTTDQIVFATGRDGSYQIAVMDSAGDNLELLTQNGDDVVNQHPVFNEDCSTIVWERNSHLWKMNADGSNPEGLSAPAATDHVGHPWVGADNWVYFVGDIQDTHTLWRTPLDGNEPPEQLTQPDAERFHPILHKDRTHVLYTWSPLGVKDAGQAIRVFNMESGGDVALYEPGWPVSAATWHPDGGSAIVAEDEDNDGTFTIALVDYPGGNRTATLIHGDDNTIPYFNYPAGDKINWVRRAEDESREIWGALADGSNAENLSRHPGEDTKIVGWAIEPSASDPSVNECVPRPAACVPNPPPCPLDDDPSDPPNPPPSEEEELFGG